MKRKITRKKMSLKESGQQTLEKVPLGKGLIPEPESIYIFSKQSIVPALTCM